jgi:hypothetical protein
MLTLKLTELSDSTLFAILEDAFRVRNTEIISQLEAELLGRAKDRGLEI